MWSKSNYDVLLSFLNAHGVEHSTARAVLGILLLAQSPGDDRCDELLNQLRQQNATLDTPVLLEILDAATPAQASEVLWGPIGLHLSTSTFVRLFRNIIAAAPDDRSLYRVIGAAVDFLQRNPGTFSIPVDIVTHLLRSSQFDARIVAMKAMRHANVAIHFQVECILQHLSSCECGEREIGLHVLGTLVTSLGIGLLEQLNVGQEHQLYERLAQLAKETDEVSYTAVRNCLEVLFPFGDDGRRRGEA